MKHTRLQQFASMDVHALLRNCAYWLTVLVIFLIPWDDLELIDIGRPVTVARIAVAVAAVFWIGGVVISGRVRKPHRIHIIIYAYIVWNILSALWSIDIDATLERVLIYSQMAILVLMVWSLFRRPRDLEIGLQSYVLGGYVLIASAIGNYVTGVEATYLRYSASGLGPNRIGLTMALGIPVAWYLATSKGSGWLRGPLRLANFMFIPAALLAIFLSGSRGSLVATVPAAVLIVGSIGGLSWPLRSAVLIAFVASIIALSSIVPDTSVQRLSTIGDAIADWDLGGRASIWGEGIEVFARHPLLGVGSGAFGAAHPLGLSAHNSFLSVLVEVGIVGVFLFFVILTMTLLEAMRQPRRVSRFWLSLLIVLLIGNLVHNDERATTTWLFLALAIVSPSLIWRSRRTPAATNRGRLRSEEI